MNQQPDRNQSLSDRLNAGTITLGVVLGVAIGLVIGVAIDDTGLGIGFGLGIGIAIAIAMTYMRRKPPAGG
jgi:hypothetical protein